MSWCSVPQAYGKWRSNPALAAAIFALTRGCSGGACWPTVMTSCPFWGARCCHRRSAADPQGSHRSPARRAVDCRGHPADNDGSGCCSIPRHRAHGGRFRDEPVYELFAQAIADRKQIFCTYEGLPRELCPHILGHTKGEEVALTYQFGGQSKSGLPPGGEWRCLSLSKVRNVRLRDGRWHAGLRHTRPQPCVEDVDLDVNPSSPYRPRRRL